MKSFLARVQLKIKWPQFHPVLLVKVRIHLYLQTVNWTAIFRMIRVFLWAFQNAWTAPPYLFLSTPHIPMTTSALGIAAHAMACSTSSQIINANTLKISVNSKNMWFVRIFELNLHQLWIVTHNGDFTTSSNRRSSTYCYIERNFKAHNVSVTRSNCKGVFELYGWITTSEC